MAQGRLFLPRFAIACVVVGTTYNLRQPTFVPAPSRRPEPFSLLSAGAGLAGAISAAPSAFAAEPKAIQDPVDRAAIKLTAAIYPLMQEIDWVKSPAVTKWFSSASSNWSPVDVAGAAKKVLEAGIAMEPGLVRNAVLAHDVALKAAMKNPKLMAPQPVVEEVASSVARLIASAGDERSMAVYNAFANLGFADFQNDFYRTMDRREVDAVKDAWFEMVAVAHP